MALPTDNCPICSSLEETTVTRILSLLQNRNYVKGSIILDPTSTEYGLYLISKGSIKVSKISVSGKEIVLKILEPGETFGESGVLSDSAGGDTITALSACEIYYLSKRDVAPLLAQKPELYHSVVASLIRWSNTLNLVIENINLSSAKERVLTYLGRLYKEQGSTLTLDKKKHDVALMLGLRPETFSRTLGELEAQGLIKTNHRKIEVLNAAEFLNFG